MASGYFPINPDNEAGQKLGQALKLIQEVADEYTQYILQDGLTYDDAFFDGCAVGRLQSAADNIKHAIAS